MGLETARLSVSHRKTRPVINVSLITLTFLQADFHTYPIIWLWLVLVFFTLLRDELSALLIFLSVALIVHLKGL